VGFQHKQIAGYGGADIYGWLDWSLNPSAPYTVTQQNLLIAKAKQIANAYVPISIFGPYFVYDIQFFRDFTVSSTSEVLHRRERELCAVPADHHEPGCAADQIVQQSGFGSVRDSTFVMAGHSPSKTGIDCPDAQPSTSLISLGKQDVEARHKLALGPAGGRTRVAGHDAST